MNCTACGKPIVLSPSAKQRAEKFGGTAASYSALFTIHTSCALDQRDAAVTELMRRKSENRHV